MNAFGLTARSLLHTIKPWALSWADRRLLGVSNILLAREPQWWHFAFSFLLTFFWEIEEKRAFLTGFCLKNGADFSSLWRHFFVIFQQKSLQQKSCCKKCAKLPSVQNRSKNERKTPVSFNIRSITAQWYSINLWLGRHSTYDWAVTLPMTGQS